MLVSLTLLASPALADDALLADLDKHAARLSWPAANEVYLRLLDSSRGATDHGHLVGAQAALELGQPLLAWHRLQRLEAEAGPDHEARQALEASLADHYGWVALYVPAGHAPTLEREHLPFAKVERRTIAAAAAALQAERTYRGLLPEGAYTVAGKPLTVQADWNRWQVTVVGDAPRE